MSRIEVNCNSSNGRVRFCFLNLLGNSIMLDFLFILFYFNTCQGIPPNTSNSMPSTHSPRSSFLISPSHSWGARFFSKDTAGCRREKGAATPKPTMMQANCRASVQATEYNPPNTVYLQWKWHFKLFDASRAPRAGIL